MALMSSGLFGVRGSQEISLVARMRRIQHEVERRGSVRSLCGCDCPWYSSV